MRGRAAVVGVRPEYAHVVESGPVACSYELVKDGAVVSTGQLTLPQLPRVGELLRLGGTAVEVVDVLPGPRLRLIA